MKNLSMKQCQTKSNIIQVVYKTWAETNRQIIYFWGSLKECKTIVFGPNENFVLSPDLSGWFGDKLKILNVNPLTEWHLILKVFTKEKNALN